MTIVRSSFHKRMAARLRKVGQLARYRGRRLRVRPSSQMPVLFGNTIPKSGTYLLQQILAGFAQLGAFVPAGLPVLSPFDQLTDRYRPLEDIQADLRRIQAGDICMAHLHSFPELVSDVCQPSWAVFMLLRDPRDMVVSMVHFLSSIGKQHRYYHYYHHVLDSFDQRMISVISGHGPNQEAFPDIGARLARFRAWWQQPEVCVLRYEELVNESEVTLGKILDHVAAHGFQPEHPRSAAIEILKSAIQPQRSPTFRKGRVGDWRSSFQEHHIKLFKESAGELLIELGYEDDLEW